MTIKQGSHDLTKGPDSVQPLQTTLTCFTLNSCEHMNAIFIMIFISELLRHCTLH